MKEAMDTHIRETACILATCDHRAALELQYKVFSILLFEFQTGVAHTNNNQKALATSSTKVKLQLSPREITLIV